MALVRSVDVVETQDAIKFKAELAGMKPEDLKLEATYENGVLEVKLPTTEEAKPKRIAQDTR